LSVGGEIPAWLTAALCPLFAGVAAAYAAVGLGGGTGYVAIMVLAGLPPDSVPATALLLNLVVSGAAALRYGLGGRLKAAVLLPFLLPAIPAALVGGLCEAPHQVLLFSLSAALIVAAAATFHLATHGDKHPRDPTRLTRIAVGVPCGAVIGFVSGLVGIGGGVFVGPLILFLRWSGPKEVAAMNAVLVLALSAAGLVGHGLRGSISFSLVLPFALAALVGGLLGAHFGERRLSPATLQKVLAVVVLAAGIKAAVDACCIGH
jgi:uncharacterized protein